jgi:hypothetical protein
MWPGFALWISKRRLSDLAVKFIGLYDKILMPPDCQEAGMGLNRSINRPALRRDAFAAIFSPSMAISG